MRERVIVFVPSVCLSVCRSVCSDFGDELTQDLNQNGNPHRGSKAIWKEKLKQRYSGCTLPSEWVPEMTVIDVMFFLHCKPLRTVKTLSDYVKTFYCATILLNILIQVFKNKLALMNNNNTVKTSAVVDCYVL